MGTPLSLARRKLSMRWPAYSGETSSSWTLGVWGAVVVMAAMITIFYGIEALNHCCYSRERRQKRPGQRTSGKLPALTIAIHQDARPSYGAFATLEGSRL
ncbi:conserved hypothetical protein [Pseudomonas marginalis]